MRGIEAVEEQEMVLEIFRPGSGQGLRIIGNYGRVQCKSNSKPRNRTLCKNFFKNIFGLFSLDFSAAKSTIVLGLADS